MSRRCVSCPTSRPALHPPPPPPAPPPAPPAPDPAAAATAAAAAAASTLSRLKTHSGSTYTYIIFDHASRECVLIDPVDVTSARDVQLIRSLNLTPVLSIETHCHADHITAGFLMKQAFPSIKTVCPLLEGTNADVQPQHGETLTVGSIQLQCLATPGHTAGSMSYAWNNNGQVHLYTGDTLLIGGCGRSDFQSGSAEKLYHSIKDVLYTFPDQSIVWPGHDYKGNFSSSIGNEKSANPRCDMTRTLPDFIAIMNGLNLPPPKRIDEVLPVNLRSGADAPPPVPPPASSGPYAGDVTPQEAFAMIQAGKALLCDIRTSAEVHWTGYVPGSQFVQWKLFDGTAALKENPQFKQQLASAVPDKSIPLVMMCRSAKRSVPAARAATAEGYTAYNISFGFLGVLDKATATTQAQTMPPAGAFHARAGQYHGGWTSDPALPWRQDII